LKIEAGSHSTFARVIRPRMPAAVAGLLVVGAGLGARYGLSGFWAKYLGVALYAAIIYALVAFIKPGMPVVRTGAIALLVCWLIEFGQLTWVPAWLSSKHLILRLIFGALFSGWDLPAYLLGVALAAGAQALWRSSNTNKFRQ
jgi:hypothetical protein